MKIIRANFLNIWWWLEKLLRYTRRLYSDKLYIRFAYYIKMRECINLTSPKTYQEKLNWLKLYYHNKLLTTLVDKYLVKEYVSNLLGEEYVVKNYGLWNNFDDIDFDTLPNSFVLKCTHDSASYVLIRDKRLMNLKEIKKKLESHLKLNYYNVHREWPYKYCTPRIMAEEYLNFELNQPLIDYKFFCFNGKPKIMYISADTSDNARTDFFDMNYNHIDMRMKDLNSNELPHKPYFFDKMKEMAEILSQGLPHVRVDFYYANNRIYFGEMTFFHNGGFQRIYPNKWNLILGDWISLPEPINE